jgi:Subtilase family/RTX calcium-binding nonapeptide repeat (4 copies)
MPVEIPNTWIRASVDSAAELQIEIPETIIRNTYTLNDILPLDSQNANLIGLSQYQANFLYNQIDGSGTSIVIIDSGADLDHIAFGADLNADGRADRIVFSYDFSGTNDADASDFSGHGTHVAAIAAGSFNALGTARGANIIVLKVFPDGNGGAADADINEALQWVAANASTFNIVSVNLSPGNGSNNSTVTNSVFSSAMNSVKAQGVAVVAAAGNSYGSFQTLGVSIPASDSAAWAVGAVYDASVGSVAYGGGATDFTTGADRIASFSQRSPTLTDFFAPGAFVYSAGLNNTFQERAGTSMAALFVAGLVSLAQDLALEMTGAKLSVDALYKIIRDSAVVIYDGNNGTIASDVVEDDNVVNTEATYKRINVPATMDAIVAHFGLGRSATLDGSGNYQDADAFFGWRGNDFLTGRGTGDTLSGNAGNDWLDGQGGNDILAGGSGADSLAGGTGWDTASYAGAAAGLTARLYNTNGLHN